MSTNKNSADEYNKSRALMQGASHSEIHNPSQFRPI